MTRTQRLLRWAHARPALLLFLFAFTLYALSMGAARNGGGYSADGTFAFEMAKSVMVDRGHAYLRDQNRNFSRWGVGLPTAFMPIVAFAEPLAEAAPQRDRIPLGEHDVLLVNFPPLGGSPGPQVTDEIELGIEPGSYDRLALLSHSGLSAGFSQGTEIARLHLTDAAGATSDHPIRVGIETAEWAYDRGDVRARIQHEQPPPVARQIGNARAHYYGSTWRFDPPRELLSARVTYLQPTGNFYVDGLALRTSDGAWLDGPGVGRVWSERQNREFFRRIWVAAANALATAVGVVLVYRILRRLQYGERVAIVSALIYAVGTMAWPYAKFDFSEPLVTTFLLAAVWLSLVYGSTGRLRFVALAGLAAFAAVLTKYVSVITVPILMTGLVVGAHSGDSWRKTLRQSVRPVLLFLAPFLIVLLPALVAAATLFDFRLLYVHELIGGLQRGWLELPFGLGLGGLITSWGKGVLWYNPILLVTLPALPWFVHRHGWRSLIFLAIPVAYALLYSRKQVWYGGNAWGPRYLVPALPLLVIVGAPLFERVTERARTWLPGAALAGVVLISAGVQFMGVSKDFAGYLDLFQQQVADAIPLKGAIYGGADYQPWSSIQPEGDYAAVLYAYQFSPLLAHAWLLRADATNLLAPDRTDWLADALSRTPWSRFGIEAIPPRPENGLGLDFWSLSLVEGFLAYPVFIVWVSVLLLVLQFATLGAWVGLTGRIWPSECRVRSLRFVAIGAFAALLISFDTLHFML
ncbi:MAG: phospholipid carrier-dependent glycosyltransferase [Chloroflexi bacterium]|nr:phospholipid carrier-dependent glycosyltransferase [Chloroflexota bacterium]